MSLGKGVAAMSAVVLVLGVGVARADEPAGDWIGALATAVGELHLAVHLHPRPDGGYQGTLDSLDQGARDLALSDILATPSSLSFSVAVVHGRYVATWDGAQHDWNGGVEPRRDRAALEAQSRRRATRADGPGAGW